MILKKFGCEQFAGIREQEFELKDHMNVIVGNNESGKTTMMDMIYHVLNTGVDLKRNEKKEFFEVFMPAEKTSGFSGDCVDGSVTFETEKGIFTIKKEWFREEDSSCRLKAEDGSVIKSKKNVEKMMREELEFGQAVYRNLIFSSQKDREQVLRGILRASEDDGVKEAKGELASRINQTVMELDGVSIEKLEEEIQERIKEYENNWDSERKRPKAKSPGKGTGERWSKNVGKILQSYYAMEDKEREKEQAERAEEAYERARIELEQAKRFAEEAAKEQNEYQKYVQDIKSRYQNEELTRNYEKELCVCEKDVGEWPEFTEKCERLQGLKEEWEKAEHVLSVRECYKTWKKQEEEMEKLREELKDAGDVSEKNYKAAKKCAYELEKQQAVLKNMSGLKGKIQVREGLKAEIHQGADARPVTVTNGEFELEEAFQIRIPEVMDFMLYPKDVDMDAVLLEYKRCGEEQKRILGTYGIKQMEQLEEKYKRCEDIRTNIRLQEMKYSQFLEEHNGVDIKGEYLEAEAMKIRDLDEISQEICEICDINEVSEMLGSLRANLQRLSEKYGDQEKLAGKREELREKLAKLKEELGRIREIPEKYRELTEIEEAEKEFRQKLEEAEALRREKETIFLQCEGALPEKTYEDIEPEYERAREEFEKNLETCSYWKHILSVFEDTRADMNRNPSLDIQEKMKQYLEKMTGGKVTVQTEEGLDTNVISGGSRMNYRLLSEGTKETVSLAFRLAVLENLYGEKKGFAVFDDTMIDMDPERRQAAAKILKKFSEKYQVIYVTCDPRFGELLGGNKIVI